MARKHYTFDETSLLDGFGLSAAHCDFGADDTPPHTHDFHELVVVASGAGIHHFSGERFKIAAGNVFLVTPGQEHAYFNRDHLEIYNVYFQEGVLAPYRHEFEQISGFHLLFNLVPHMSIEKRASGNLGIPRSRLAEAVGLAQGIQRELTRGEPGCRVTATCDFLQLLMLISRECLTSDSQHYHHAQQISRVLSFIEGHYPEPLSLSDLAKPANLSVSAFRRAFGEVVGIPPIKYLLNFRLQKAAERLRSGAGALSETAFACGFNDSNYFSAQFHRFFGIAPLKYRQRFAPLRK